jgi:hypothetical protein
MVIVHASGNRTSFPQTTTRPFKRRNLSDGDRYPGKFKLNCFLKHFEFTVYSPHYVTLMQFGTKAKHVRRRQATGSICTTQEAYH